MSENQIREYISRVRWQESKDKSHSYTLVKWASELSDDFFGFVQYIRDYGYEVWFYGKPYTCFDVDGMRYWSMGAPLSETILINRAINLPGNPHLIESNPVVEQDNSINLHFHGPFKFTAGDNDLFKSEFARSEGIYIWTIKDEMNNANYVHYIGETFSFAKRMREHFTHIAGLNYRILEPAAARQGIELRIWNGMWKDKTASAVANVLERYEEVTERVVEYVGLINVYFAPTTLETQLRKHVEGCIGWNLRKKNKIDPDLKLTRFYPDDNHVGTKSKPIGKTLKIILEEPIAGIDAELGI
jgi:hypothetical protein